MSSPPSSFTRGGEPHGGGGRSHAHAHAHDPPRAREELEQEIHHDGRRPGEWRTTWRARGHGQQQEQPWRRHRRQRSAALQWAAAVLCTVLAVVVLLGAVSILVVVLLLQPRAPYVAVRAARLDALQYDQLGTLDDVQLSLRVEARNDNAHSPASFAGLECRIAFAGGAAPIVVLRADAFRVPARGALPLAYVARARGAPLGDAGSAAMESALRDGVVPFRVEGEARTRWKVAGIVTINQWTRLACQMRFFWPNGTALPFRCSSKSKFLFF